MTLHTTLSEQLAHAYIATRLEKAHSRRTASLAGRRGRGRRRRTAAPDSYTDYLTSGGTIR